MHFGTLGRLLAPTGRASAAVDRWLRSEPMFYSGASAGPLRDKQRIDYVTCDTCGKRRGVIGFEERPLPHRCRR